MRQRESLAQLTLDTLPFNIAVLNEEGTILFTNRAWREFSGVGGGQGAMFGRNYFDGIDEDADEYATEALDGIRSVIERERDVFKLEYPCHSPDEKRWFLMRAAQLPDHDEGSVVVAHMDITQRKLAEIRAREKRRELEHLMSRIDGLVQNVMEAALHASSREEIEATLCDRLVGVEPYLAAWISRVDLRTEEIVPAASAGKSAPSAETKLTLSADDPTAAAVRTGEPQVVRQTSETSLDAVHEQPLEMIQPSGDTPAGETTAAGERQGAVAAFPLVYSDTDYGVLTVYAGQADAFDERELAVLQVLARVASTAINAIEGRRILTSDRVIEMELALSDDGLFFRDIATALDCSFQYEGSIYQDDGSVTMLFVVRDAAPEAVIEQAQVHSGIESVTHVSDSEDGSVFEFRVVEQPIVSLLAQRGAETTDITAHSREARITLELPASADAREVIEQLSAVYPSTQLVARRERERPGQTKQELVADIESKLTGRQRLALQKAFLGGFFNWPRGVSGEELAASMDISPSTYHQHLRSAEKKVIEALFAD